MIKITKGPQPTVLRINGRRWTRLLRKAKKKGGDVDAVRKYYRHEQITDALLKETHGKCCYCECDPLPGMYRNVEHVVPWSADASMAFSWKNLLFICERCNSAKLQYWDLQNPLINPVRDEPTNELLFVGSMVFGATDKGVESVVQIKLNRAGLYESRKKLLKQIEKLAINYARQGIPQNTARDILLQTFAGPQERFSQTAKNFIARVF
jgi:uncharacterized protein (TIGR02646 family)